MQSIAINKFEFPGEHVAAMQAVQRFASGRSTRCYLVGGYIRDLLLGKRPFDLDLVIPRYFCGELAEFLSNQLGFSRPVVFKRFETFHLAGKGIEIQISPLVGNLLDDAIKRDFTINCLYVDIRDFGKASINLIDPTNRAFNDIQERILRTPTDPEITFWSDPLRQLRAIRFLAVLGMEIDTSVINAIRRMAYLVSRISNERVRVELEHIILSERVRKAFKILQKTRLLSIILPEVDRMYGFDQRCRYHTYDLFEHSVRVVEALPRSLELRLSGLFHDVGKIETCRQLEDRNTYYGHEKVSARIAVSALSRLRFPMRIIEVVEFLIENHMVNYDDTWSDRAIRRLVRRIGERLNPLLTLLEADRSSQRGGLKNIRSLRRRINLLSGYVEKSREDILDGNEIMEILGIGPGPLIGRAKEYLLEVSDSTGRILTKAEAASLLQKWFKRLSSCKRSGR